MPTAAVTLKVKLTKRGIELMKCTNMLNVYKKLSSQILDDLITQSSPVKIVNDPNSETDNNYIVISINPSAPIIREVPKDYEGSYRTLAQAKQASREIIQKSIEDAKQSLVELRQVGLNTIRYINL
ncbi:hypothetical protein MNBD_GAMMA01-1116 [hydrothermal vent metagenome]|uniref:Uncharacterized protein n=1 Tax=hydrothermal vent metagenome TaxID=652676 RepID=A0A3B0VTF3_9ZZZZ